MPVYLKEVHRFPELEGCSSALVVPCRFCPAASMAVSHQEPYFQFARHFLKTPAYEQHIHTVVSNLQQSGVRADVFHSRWPHQFVVCMWSARRREKLMKHARRYDALVVLGCEAAVETIRDAVRSLSCQVIQGMETQGIMSIQPHFHLPCSLSLELNGVTPLQHRPSQS